MADIKEYFLNQNYNCAESLLLAANDRWNLNITEDEVKLLGGFGGGLCYGRNCGALCASVAVISRLYNKTKARENPELKARCHAFAEAFEERFGDCDCDFLKPQYNEADVRCYHLVNGTLELLADFLAEQEEA